MKSSIFDKEIEYITDIRIQQSARTIINNLPDYFFEIQAASTGKYHPKYALGEKGLIRHTKAAVYFANTLFGIYKFDDNTKDLIILSLLIHDGLKKGIKEEKYTRFDHPIIVGEFLDSIKKDLSLNDKELDEIKNNVSSHMGKWNTNEYSDVVLPLPTSVTQKFVHMCDYLASRKEIHFEFDSNNNIITE